MKTRLLLLVAALALLASPVLADTLNTTATWNAWTTATQGNAVPFGGTPFWGNVSNDGANCNIGFWLTGTGNCGVSNFYALSPNTIGAGSYLGDGTGSILFTADGATTSVRVGVGISAVSATTEFGWFSTADPGTLHPILSGGAMGATASFSVLSGDYGFYLRVVDPRPEAVTPLAMFTSNTTDGLNRGHFSLFDLGGGHYVLGIEDKQGDLSGAISNLSDYDYNDLVVELTTTPVPEPGSILLLGIGLIGGATVLRKRAKK